MAYFTCELRNTRRIYIDIAAMNVTLLFCREEG